MTKAITKPVAPVLSYFAIRFLLLLALCLLPAPLSAHMAVDDRIDELTEAMKREPEKTRLYLERGEQHRVHRQWEKGLADFDRAALLAPSMPEVDLARGRLLLDAGRAEDAMSPLNRLLTKAPDHRTGLVMRARTRVQLRRFLAAAADFTAAISLLDQPAPEYYLERAQALAAAGGGHIDDALSGLDEGMKRLGNIITLQAMAIDLEMTKQRYHKALQRLAQVPAALKRSPDWLVKEGDLLMSANRPEEAQRVYRQALKKIEQLPPARRKSRAFVTMEERLQHLLKGQPLPD